VNKIFPRIAPKEAVKIAEFLVNYSSIDFKRTDFESFTSVYKTARTAQKRLRELVNHNLLTEKEKGIYCVKRFQMKNSAGERFLALTAPKGEYPEFDSRILMNDVLTLVAKSKGIYISTKTENRKKVSVGLANLLSENYAVLYFSFDDTGIENLVETIQSEVINQNPYPDIEETLKKQQTSIYAYRFYRVIYVCCLMNSIPLSLFLNMWINSPGRKGKSCCPGY
jgi:hypothetical protein